MPYRIFLVEDHLTMRQIFTQVFEREPDFEVCGAAGTAEDALAALVATSCDLVVTDLALPGMDGIDLIERLGDEKPGLPALVLSAHDDEVFVRRAERAGARAFLSKRAAPSVIVSAVRRVLTDGTSDSIST